MMQDLSTSAWDHFKQINKDRRAVKDLDNSAIPDEDISAILEEALLAPSSANAQPYEIHWIRSEELKKAVAEACNGQKAARQASTLFVFVAGTAVAKDTLSRYQGYVQRSETLSERSKAFHLDIIKKISGFLKIAPLVIWTPIIGFISWFVPSLSILPFGALGVRHWATKNSIFAAQNLMLAATAKGYDTCPMEGFNAAKVASLLKLPYGSVIPVIIAFGKRTASNDNEPQWRRTFGEAIKIR